MRYRKSQSIWEHRTQHKLINSIQLKKHQSDFEDCSSVSGVREGGRAEVEFILFLADLELPGRYSRRVRTLYSPQSACLSWADAPILALLPFPLFLSWNLTCCTQNTSKLNKLHINKTSLVISSLTGYRKKRQTQLTKIKTDQYENTT